MMWKEFEEIAGYEVTYETYTNIIEPMYNAVNLNKRDFVKLLDKKAFALPTKAEMKREMRKIANVIFSGCGVRTFHEEENKLEALTKEYAKRFYGVDWAHDTDTYVFTTKAYAYCGVRQDRGCSFPETVVIGRGDYEYERIVLIA